MEEKQSGVPFGFVIFVWFILAITLANHLRLNELEDLVNEAKPVEQ